MRQFIGDTTHIDGRTIPYGLVTAYDYLQAKYDYTEGQTEYFQENNNEIYLLINQIMAIKQSCFLLRRVSYSCGSLSDNLYELKLRLMRQLEDDYSFEFDDDFVENYGHDDDY